MINANTTTNFTFEDLKSNIDKLNNIYPMFKKEDTYPVYYGEKIIVDKNIDYRVIASNLCYIPSLTTKFHKKLTRYDLMDFD